MKREAATILALVGILLAGSHHVQGDQQEPSKYSIVPGVRVGEFTPGMGKDDVLKKLGEPETIQLGENDVVRRGEKGYGVDDLPRESVLSFGDISFFVHEDSVEAIFVRSPLYRLGNRLGVGDSQQKITQAFGEDFQTEEMLGKHYICYLAKGLAFAIDKKGHTVAEVAVYRPEKDGNDDDSLGQGTHSVQIIEPGIGVGDYTLGMSKDDVMKKLGDPQSIFLGSETYTLENLPRRYYMSYGHISFRVEEDSVTGIGLHKPLYQFANGVRVGDSVDKIKQVFGSDFEPEEFERTGALTYKAKGLRFEIDQQTGTIEEIGIFQPEGNRGDNSKPKVDARGELTAFEDVRGKDLRASDLRYSEDILDTLEFNQETQWPPPERLPKGFDPKRLLEEGMNPGLGIRDLHAQGITGAGVHVGLIDQPLLPDHPEYVGNIASYYALDCGSSKSSMHGPGMASQLVGKRCGTAPGASLHVVAVPSWKADAGYYARALERFVAYNENAPKKQKIRVVSVSCQPSGEGSVFKNQSLWDEAVERAQDKGILVLDCTWHHGFVSLCWLDPENQESVEACTPGFRNGDVEVDEGLIHVPSAPRTAAEAYEDRVFGYAYDGGGRRSRRPKAKNGYSDTIPYTAGILALGWQIRPDLTPAQIKELLFASAYVHESGAKIINPKAFIEAVKRLKQSQHVILPGVSVGDYTLGMSKEDVLKKLGDPESIQLRENEILHRGQAGYSVSDLPSKCILYFADLWFLIEHNSVGAISARSPLYKLSNGLKLGDPEQNIKQVFGEDFTPKEAFGKDFLRYDAEGLAFGIDKKDRTVAEIVVYQPKGDGGDREALDAKNRSRIALVRQAAAKGRILYKVTTPEEFKEIAGEPPKEWPDEDGEVIYMEYPGIEVKFIGNGDRPHTVEYVLCERMGIDIGQDRSMDEGDLDQQPDRSVSKDVSTLVRQAAADGRILFKLTTVAEFKEIIGQPTEEEVGNTRGTRVNLLYLPGVTASFFGWPDEPRTLGQVSCESEQIDIGQNRPVVLRDARDLSKFGKYNSICGADLSRLDLSQKGDLLERMTFDGLTVWPQPGRLPPGFEPSRRLEEGKNPGLGVRSLHQKGIDGSGVGIAIVDGILRKDHIEYADRIKSYHMREAEGGSHAPPVCSIAVGKTCGVAPGASLHFYGVRAGDNRRYARAVEEIVGRNRDLPASEKVRVISISIGVSQRDHYDQWRAATDKAKRNGILVVTCDKQDFMPYGTLKRIVGKDPDDPKNYGPSYLSGDGNALVYVPIENRSMASHRGKDVYTFDTYGGNSWAAPYLAGLAALAFQVHPEISPDEIVELWQETATRTRVGPVVNPRGFIEAVKRIKQSVPASRTPEMIRAD